MAGRHVTRSGKDRTGTSLRSAELGAGVARRMRSGISNARPPTHTYYTNVGGRRANVRVYTDRRGVQHLTTNPDAYKPNNLDNLPNC